MVGLIVGNSTTDGMLSKEYHNISSYVTSMQYLMDYTMICNPTHKPLHRSHKLREHGAQWLWLDVAGNSWIYKTWWYRTLASSVRWNKCVGGNLAKGKDCQTVRRNIVQKGKNKRQEVMCLTKSETEVVLVWELTADLLVNGQITRAVI